MDNKFVRIGGVRYRLTPIDDEPMEIENEDNIAPTGISPAGEEPNRDVAQQQLQAQQEMLALMTGDGINVNVKNLDTQARFGS